MPKIEQERAVPAMPVPGQSRLGRGMIPGMNLYPTYSPALPCETMDCRWRHFAIGVCRQESCPHAWARAGAEDRARREEHDRKMTETAAPPVCRKVGCAFVDEPVRKCRKVDCIFIAERSMAAPHQVMPPVAGMIDEK